MIHWCPPHAMLGPAPIGEIEQWCPSCSRQFRSGEQVTSTVVAAPWPIVVTVHAGNCAAAYVARLN